jgi:hypothetical protein
VSGIYGGSVVSAEGKFSSLETVKYISLRRRMLFVTNDGAVLISEFHKTLTRIRKTQRETRKIRNLRDRSTLNEFGINKSFGISDRAT